MQWMCRDDENGNDHRSSSDQTTAASCPTCRKPLYHPQDYLRLERKLYPKTVLEDLRLRERNRVVGTDGAWMRMLEVFLFFCAILFLALYLLSDSGNVVSPGPN